MDALAVAVQRARMARFQPQMPPQMLKVPVVIEQVAPPPPAPPAVTTFPVHLFIEPPRMPVRDYPMARAIQRAVAEFYAVTILDLICKRRTARLVRPRQVAVYLCRELTPLSFPHIGRRFGNRDHTTTLHAWRKIKRLIETDMELAMEIEQLKKMLAK